MHATTILTDRHGTAIDASLPPERDPAKPHPFAALPPLPIGVPCAESVHARDGSGAAVCTLSCAQRFVPGQVQEHGVVTVHGLAARLRCQSLHDHRLVTISPTPTSSPGDPTLSPREREILALVARGFTSARIAKRLGLKPSTVRTHVEHIRDKLGVRTRAQAVAKATALGQVES